MSKHTGQWVIKFFGTAHPILVPKIRSTNHNTLSRPGLELWCDMQATKLMYYIDGLPLPLTDVEMKMSIFLTTLSKLFNPHKKEDEIAAWVYYGDAIYVS